MNKIICHDINGQPKEVDDSQLKFRPAVYGILIQGNKILLSSQWDGYDFPGGGVKLGETLDQALEREFWEETGLKVKRERVIACESSFFMTVETNKPVHSILLYFTCIRVGGELTTKNFDEHEKNYTKLAEWKDLEEVSQLKFYNSVDSLKIVEQALKQQK